MWKRRVRGRAVICDDSGRCWWPHDNSHLPHPHRPLPPANCKLSIDNRGPRSSRSRPDTPQRLFHGFRVFYLLQQIFFSSLAVSRTNFTRTLSFIVQILNYRGLNENYNSHLADSSHNIRFLVRILETHGFKRKITINSPAIISPISG